MPAINPYLSFKNNCEEAFEFYRSVFGGEFQVPGIVRMGDMDLADQPMPEEAKNLVMHVALPIGEGTTLMGSDAPEGFGPPLNVGNNISVAITTDSVEESDRLFNGLSKGGSVTMPMADAPWGAYFGMFTDKFGINWMINHDRSPKS